MTSCPAVLAMTKRFSSYYSSSKCPAIRAVTGWFVGLSCVRPVHTFLGEHLSRLKRSSNHVETGADV